MQILTITNQGKIVKTFLLSIELPPRARDWIIIVLDGSSINLDRKLNEIEHFLEECNILMKFSELEIKVE